MNINHGFAMLHQLEQHLNLHTLEGQTFVIQNLVALDFKPTDTSAEFMSCLNAIASTLQGVLVQGMLHLFTLFKLDPTQYTSIIQFYKQADSIPIAPFMTPMLWVA